MKAIHILKKQHSITILCRVLNVNRSTYYNNLYKPISFRTIQNQEISTKILSIYSSTRKRLGAVKIKVLLKSIYSINVSVGRVYLLMKYLQLPKMSTIKPRFKKSNSQETLSPTNPLNQQFNVSYPNHVWCSDITYIPIGNGFAYLCIVMDPFARKIVSWNLSLRMTAEFVIETVKSALSKRNISSSIIFHSDQGSQYTSKQFRVFIDENNFIQSFSSKSYPWDNAVVEAFFKFIKPEELNRRQYTSLSELKLAIFEYIEGFYNSRRPHSANNYLSPNQKELQYFENLSS